MSVLEGKVLIDFLPLFNFLQNTLTIAFCLHFIVCLNFLIIRLIFAPSGTFIEPPSDSVVDASFWRETNDGKWVSSKNKVIKMHSTGCKQHPCNRIGKFSLFFHSQFYFSRSLSLEAEKYGIIVYVVTYTITLFASVVEEKTITDVSSSFDGFALLSYEGAFNVLILGAFKSLQQNNPKQNAKI